MFCYNSNKKKKEKKTDKNSAEELDRLLNTFFRCICGLLSLVLKVAHLSQA